MQHHLGKLGRLEKRAEFTTLPKVCWDGAGSTWGLQLPFLLGAKGLGVSFYGCKLIYECLAQGDPRPLWQEAQWIPGPLLPVPGERISGAGLGISQN